VLFAGTAFTQSPLSSDYEVLREFLPELNPDYLPQGGTNYAAMLDVVLESFSQGPDTSADRYLIILSDGESLSDDWQSRMDALKEAGVKVIGLGVGTQEGAVIQEPDGGVIKDENGSVVLSRLNAATLQALARGTGGEYRQADRWLDLPQLLKETVEKGRKGDFSEKKDRKPMERYQLPLLISLLLFAMSMWREYPVRPRVAKQEENQKKTSSPPPIPAGVALVLICVMVLATQVQAQGPPSEPAQPEPQQQLVAEVSQLSGKNELQTGDYQSLAEVTISAGKAAVQQRDSLPRGAIEDALQGVFEGEKLDAKAADWESLRKELEALLEKAPEEDKKDQQDQDNQDQQDKNQENQQENQDQQQGGQGDANDQNQQNQDSPQDSENSDQQNSDSQQNKDENQQDGSDSKNQQSQGSQGQDQKDQGEQGEQNQGSENSDQQEPSKPQQSDSTPGEDSKQNEQNQMGPLDEGKPEDASKNKEPEQKQGQGKPQKLQTVKGSTTESGGTQSKDPKVIAAMKELEGVKGRDVPAELFQRMQGDQQQPQKNGKDW
jgi:Ca-activated chloride channel family protein